jgi:hypothetical protein
MARRPLVYEAQVALHETASAPQNPFELPDLEFSKTAVLNNLTSADGQRGYSHAIDEFVD